MKNTLALLCLLFFSIGYAQKDTLRFNLNGNEVIILTDDITKLSTTDINGMVNQVNKETNELIKEYEERTGAIKKQYDEGEISKEEYEAQMELETERFEVKMEALSEEMEIWSEAYAEKWEEWAENYAEQWEAWAESYGEDWEKWAEQWEEEAAENNRNGVPPPPPPPTIENAPRAENDTASSKNGTVITITPDGIEIKEGEEKSKIEYKRKSKKKQVRTEGQGDIHFGWNNHFSDNKIVKNDNAELRSWKSTVFTIGGAAKTRIGKDKSKFYIRYGMQINWHNFRLKGNNVITKTTVPDGIAYLPLSDINPEISNVSKSKYSAIYLDVPLTFGLDFSKRGMDNAIDIMVGGYGGLRINQKRKVKFDDFNNDPVKQKIKNNLYMNQWRYGLMAQLGFGNFKITAKYDLNPLFRTDKETPDYQIGSIAFGFAF